MDNHKLRQLQLIETEMLEAFAEICEKNDLTYYLCFGTLLGAIRHKGFIPWDDDIDVVMPRKDFEIFRKIAPKELNSEYFFHDNKVDKDEPSGLIRIRKNNTIYADEKTLRLNLMHYGIWLDIYALDNVSSPNSLLFNIQVFLRMFLYHITVQRALKNCHDLSLIRRVVHYLSCILPTKIWSDIRDFVYRLNKNDNSEYCICFYAAFKTRDLKKHIMQKSDLYPPVKAEFEGREYNVPNNWDHILKQSYGDYMTLPPEEERTTFHNPSVWKM